MASYSLHYREELPAAVVKELDDMVAHFNNVLSASMNNDGTLLVSDPNSGGPSAMDQVEAVEGHWWKKGPWRFDTDSTHEAFIFTPQIPAGTYNDFTPQGIDTCIGVEINLAGDITLTGVKAPDKAYRRLVVLRNQSSSHTVTLKHQSTSSAQLNRFALPGNTDIVLKQNQTVWLYYDADNHYWASFITPNFSGGLAGAGSGSTGGDVVGPAGAVDNHIAVFDGVTGKLIKDGGDTVAGIIAAAASWTVGTTTIAQGRLETLNTPLILVPAPGSNQVIVVSSITVAVTQTAAYAGGSTWHFQYGGSGAVEIVAAFSNDLGLNRNKMYIRYPTDYGIFAANVSAVNNATLVMFADANPTGGGAATAVVTVAYRIVGCPA